jgi:hypothetical protein
MCSDLTNCLCVISGITYHDPPQIFDIGSDKSELYDLNGYNNASNPQYLLRLTMPAHHNMIIPITTRYAGCPHENGHAFAYRRYQALVTAVVAAVKAHNASLVGDGIGGRNPSVSMEKTVEITPGFAIRLLNSSNLLRIGQE